MTVIGVGVDVVDIARFERTVERTPKLLDRMFGPVEQALPLRSLAARYAVRAVPTLMFFKDGRPVDTLVGAVPKAVLLERLHTLGD